MFVEKSHTPAASGIPIGKSEFVLEGHTDYIHCIDLGKSSQECVSGSEDGTVRVWGNRKSGNAVHVLEPHKHQYTRCYDSLINGIITKRQHWFEYHHSKDLHVVGLVHVKSVGIKLYMGYESLSSEMLVQDKNCFLIDLDYGPEFCPVLITFTLFLCNVSTEGYMIASRPEFGKWIGCVALDSSDEWLVCGGAPNLCVWHLRSLAPSTQFLKPQVTTNVVCFHDDMIISGGSESFINHWSLDGKLQIEVPSSSSSVFCLGINSSSQRILAAGGSSYKIDLCTDFRYKNFSLFFCDT
ncbi:UNVERIFIED_CONTAM: thoc6 [Trichonephila clavipes]